MRRSWIILTVITALAAPMSAQAGNRDRVPRDTSSREADEPMRAGWRWADRDQRQQERAPRGGWLTVDNPNHQPLEVLVDRQPVGTVPAGEQARFGPFEGGEHRVKTRFVSSDPELNTSVSRDLVVVRGRRGAWVDAGILEQALFTLKNTWLQPMTLRVSGQTAGTVPAGGRTTLRVATGAKIEALAPGGAVAFAARASGRGLADERARIVAPARAHVDVYNPGPVPLQIVDRGTAGAVWTLAPGRTSHIEVASGRRSLQARFGDREIDSVALLASPWSTRRWSIEVPSTAALTIQNDNPMLVRAFVNGELLGTIEPGERVVFDGLELGLAEVTLEARRRRSRIQTTVQTRIDPIVGASVTSQFPIRDGRRARRTASRHETHRHTSRTSWWSDGWGWGRFASR